MNSFALTRKGYLMRMPAFGAIMLGGLLTASTTTAQVPGRPPAAMPCPNATVQMVPMTSPTVADGDFSAAALAAPRAGINDPTPNRLFLHTFRWDPPACCRITAAYVTVVMRANEAGAANDTIGLAQNGTTIPGMAGPIYSGPATIDQPTTRTFVVNAAGLAAMNANNELSLAVQDDTRVLSADLRIDRCCIR